MKTCIHCDNEINDDANFCTYCGTPQTKDLEAAIFPNQTSINNEKLKNSELDATVSRIKKSSKNYYFYFKRALSNPTENLSKFPNKFGLTNIIIFSLLQALFLISYKNLLSNFVGGIPYYYLTQNPDYSGIMFKVFIGAFIISFAIIFIRTITIWLSLKYYMKEDISLITVINKYGMYLPIGIIIMGINAIIGFLNLQVESITTVLTVGLGIIGIFIIPSYVLLSFMNDTQHKNKLFYAGLIDIILYLIIFGMTIFKIIKSINIF